MKETEMEVRSLDLAGIFPPIPTAFDERGEVSAARLKGNLAVWNRFPLRGYVVLGSNGEAVLLSAEERISVLTAAREAIPPDRLLIAGTGCPSTRETIGLSCRAASIGADALLVLPPSYYRGRMTREALVRHYSAVADAVEIPVLIYNMPACTGIDLDVGTIAAIAKHPNVVGIKDSGGNVVKLGELHGLLGPGFQILAGSAGFLLSALCVGAVGGVLALANIAPQACLDILRGFLSGDLQAAREIQVRMIPANAAVTSVGGVAALKAALDLLGLYGGPVRPPLMALETDACAALEGALSRAAIGPLKAKGE